MKGLILIISGFLFLIVSAGSVLGTVGFLKKTLHDKQVKIEQVTLDYDTLRDNVDNYIIDIQKYSAEINSAFSDVAAPAATGDLASFSTDKALLSTARDSLEQNLKTARQLNSYFKATKVFLFNIPSLWPIKSGTGMITLSYGLNPNPFTGRPYLHSGVDITTFRVGEPIVATANGTVVVAKYTSDLGNCIEISHQYGFSTVYGHFISMVVHVGQKVTRGQVIGYLGSTGMSTGPHLHYEVLIRGAITDPTSYLAVGRLSSPIADISSPSAVGGNSK